VRDLLHTAKFLLFDLASTLFFFGLYSLTQELTLSVVAGLALAFGQIGWTRCNGSAWWRWRPAAPAPCTPATRSM
jgi:hypothetical protein